MSIKLELDIETSSALCREIHALDRFRGLNWVALQPEVFETLQATLNVRHRWTRPDGPMPNLVIGDTMFIMLAGDGTP